MYGYSDAGKIFRKNWGSCRKYWELDYFHGNREYEGCEAVVMFWNGL